MPSLCLNMIVKNESAIITRLLKSVLPLIDTYCICDTGSTDDTISVIKTFFDSHNISGKIVSEPFRDFGYNRTFSLKQCDGLPNADYLLLMDADMILKIQDSLSITEFKSSLTSDAYYVNQGTPNFFYKNIRIVKNGKDISYVGVTHEYVNLPSGRVIDNIPMTQLFINDVGDGGSKTEKYDRDIRLLTQGLTDDPNNVRYIFYLANSYKDSGKKEDAIKWYKKVIDGNNWNQEKYMSCLHIYHCYNALKQQEHGMFYLVKSFAYDRERAECLYELVSYYCVNNMNEIAYGYYSIVKSFYENSFLKTDLQDKLFLDATKANLYLPYYMIIVADKVKDIQTGILMYRIIFTKKHRETNSFFIGNMLYNLQFFIDAAVKNDPSFLNLFKSYIDFLTSINYPVYQHDFMIHFVKYGISNNNCHISTFSKKECLTSNKILIYTGFRESLWNDTYISYNSLGGSEKAVAYLSRYLPKNYEIYISGDVEDEVVGNITYIHRFKLQMLLDTEKFHTIIVSRYVSFFLIYPRFSCYQLLLSAHDTDFLNNLINSDISVADIVSKVNNDIDGVVCLTKWHKNTMIKQYPVLENKMHIINNGILTHVFPNKSTKIKNKFIWTSCSERGLMTVLNIWQDILTYMPDATLDISSYNEFPKSVDDNKMLDIINKHDSIVYHGRLKAEQLYNLMSRAEYWLYTVNFCETSCITALEMLMSEVICLYYPIAGLLDTIGDYGIQIKPGNEISTILNLTESQKINMRKKGKEYAISCSWENRAKQWSKMLFDNYIANRQKLLDLHNNYSIPHSHINYLKQLAIDFTPTVIYDIGSNVLHWTKEARKIWTNSRIIAFDGTPSMEYLYLYLTYDIDYYIGVLSDKDNRYVNFYQNEELSGGGNSYYKEVGSINSNEIYPENSFTQMTTMTLNTIVKTKNFPLPDLVKIDVQGSELDIIKGGLDVINNAKYLIVELQHVQYNRGAPLANEIIHFLNENGWELIASKFSDNGPDADYCFKKKQIWAFYHNKLFNQILISQYIDNLNSIYPEYHIVLTCDREYIIKNKPHKLTFIYDVFDSNIIDELPKIKLSLLNTEPLNIPSRLQDIANILCLYPTFDYYDYSKSNITILEENNIDTLNSVYLPYFCNKNELHELTELNRTTDKTFDFGILKTAGGEVIERRRAVIDFLKQQNMSVNIIGGWGKDRDIELAKCKFILNIHGFFQMPSNIFEHIRCDRLLEAGFTILSESSYKLDTGFIEKYPRLKLIDYDEFFNIDTQNQPKIIDCFIFYNELDMLIYRLNILNDIVDFFVLVESTHTFVGKEKQLFYQENKHLFEKFNHKIIHIIVDDFPYKYPNISIEKDQQWTNERFQRNCISRGIDKLNLNNQDIITITDLDEIPNPNVLEQIKNNIISIDVNIPEMDFYYYNLHSKMDHKWYHSKIISFKKYNELNITCEQIRFYNCPIIKNGGWHLSYFGNEQFIKNKLENFAHQGLNINLFTNQEKIQNRIKNTQDLFDRPTKLIYIPIEDNENLPPKYEQYLTHFYKIRV